MTGRILDAARAGPARVVAATATAAAVAVLLLRPSETLFVATFLGGLGVAAAVAWLAGLTAPRGSRLTGILVGAGLTANLCGELFWYLLVIDKDTTDVSWADAGWLATYAFLGAALWLALVRSRGGHRADLDSVIDAATIVTVSMLVVWNLSIDAIAGDPSLTAPTRLVWSMYPICDAILIALVLRILTDARARATMSGWFAAGVACWLVADLGFLTLPLTPANESWENAGWLLGAALMARPFSSDRTVAAGEPGTRRLGILGTLSVAIAPLMVPPALAVLDDVRGIPVDSGQLVTGMVILLALAFTRTARLLRSERRAHLELEAARDAALAGSRAKSDFLATMSHEIRTPMNGVIGLTGLLLTTDLDSRQQQYAEGVRGAGDALLTIIDDILDFSKVEAGMLELEAIDFDLAQVVEGSLDLVSENATAKGLELVADVSPDLPRLFRGDPSRLRQVLLNLTGNAVKFTAVGEVVVTATPEGGEGSSGVRFEVRDTGIGIDVDESDPQRLFAPFSQADSSTTRRFGGTGLGLAISHRLVTAMGGTLSVTSEPGAGSTFTFVLPLAAPLEPAATDGCPAGLAGRRALVVEDNETQSSVLRAHLRRWGMEVDVVRDAASGRAALAGGRIAGRPYDVTLLDTGLPGADAVTCPSLVLLGTGLDQRSVKSSATHSRLVTKPLHVDRLASALSDLLAPATVSAVRGTDATSAGAGTPARRGHLLVVEDDETNQVVAEGILQHLGYTVEIAADGAAGVEAWGAGAFDLVLMDCHMPGMDGYEATRELRLREAVGQRTPVVAMTAGVVEGERERCLAAGMDDYVTKPVDPRVLDAVLTRWLGDAADVRVG